MPPEFRGYDLQAVKDKTRESARKILDYSISKQESFAGESHFLAWIYQYIFLNIFLARPSFSVVCTWERKKQLEAIGLNETAMITLIAAQAVADHVAPNFVIAGIFATMHQITDIPVSIAAPVSWLLGRTAWGAMCGVVHASSYAVVRAITDLESRSDSNQFVSEAMMNIHVPNEVDHKFSAAHF